MNSFVFFADFVVQFLKSREMQRLRQERVVGARSLQRREVETAPVMLLLISSIRT